jgi:Trk K+ transport system NAD-binding subunit
VVLIERESTAIVPSGGTVVHEGDRLLVLASRDQSSGVRALLEA